MVNLKNDFKNFEISQELKEKLDIFYNAIKKGKKRKTACNIAGLNIDDVNKWYSKGNKGIEPYNSFFKNYNEANQEHKKIKSLKSYNAKSSERKRFLEYIQDGETRKNARILARLNKKQLNTWLEFGKKGFEPYITFYNEFEKYTTFYQKYNGGKELHEHFYLKIQDGNSIDEACDSVGLKLTDVKSWLKEGKNPKSPCNNFLKKYNESLQISDSLKQEFVLKKLERYDFLFIFNKAWI